jgi:hypothetical protein
MPIVNCGVCETPIEVRAYRLKKTKRFWCSPECKSIGMQEPAVWEPIPTVAAYIAGILDGEGSVLIAERKQRGSRFRYAYLAVVITNTDMPMLEFIKRSIGAGVNFTEIVSKSKHNKLGKKPLHRLWFTHHRAVAMLKPMLPYLIIKRRKATLGIKFQELPLAERRLEAKGHVYRSLINENQK